MGWTESRRYTMTSELNAAEGSSHLKPSEEERKKALDAFGWLLMSTRDLAILQWDQILAHKRNYAPWQRLVKKFGELDDRSLEIVSEVLPHIVDTVIYCFLADIDASQAVKVSVISNGSEIKDVARLSDGLPAEPVSDNGWLVRFARQRFEQPF